MTNLFQVGATLGFNGIANVMKGIASKWKGQCHFGVFSPKGDNIWTPPSFFGKRKIMRFFPGGAVSNLQTYLQENNIEMVTAHYAPLDAIAFKAAKNLGLKRVYHYHNVTPHSFYQGVEAQRRIEEDEHMLNLMQEADVIFCDSHFSKKKIKEKIGRDATVASPAINTDLFYPTQKIEKNSKDEFRIIHLGRGVSHKGFKELLEHLIVPFLNSHSDARFDFVGSLDQDDYGQACREMLEHPSASWHQHVESHALNTIMNEADVFVSGSLFEGFGLPFLEAAACGLPSIGFHVAAIPEAVIEGVTGKLVPKNDWDAFSRVLERWYHNPKEVEELGASALKYAREQTWQKTVDVIEKHCFEDFCIS